MRGETERRADNFEVLLKPEFFFCARTARLRAGRPAVEGRAASSLAAALSLSPES